MRGTIDAIVTRLSISIGEIQHSIIVEQYVVRFTQVLVKCGFSSFYLTCPNVATRTRGLVTSTTNLDSQQRVEKIKGATLKSRV